MVLFILVIFEDFVEFGGLWMIVFVEFLVIFFILVVNVVVGVI